MLDVLLALAWLATSAVGMVVGAVLGGPSRRGRGAWAMVGLLLWPALAILVVRRLRGKGALGDLPALEGAPEPHAPMPVPEEDDLLDVPEPVTACPNCGFLGIRAPGVQDGVWPGGGELVSIVCTRCSYRGVPISFDRREAYRAFLEALPRAPPA